MKFLHITIRRLPWLYKCQKRVFFSKLSLIYPGLCPKFALFCGIFIIWEQQSWLFFTCCPIYVVVELWFNHQIASKLIYCSFWQIANQDVISHIPTVWHAVDLQDSCRCIICRALQDNFQPANRRARTDRMRAVKLPAVWPHNLTEFLFLLQLFQHFLEEF